jgi:hypothetical protein
MGHGRISSSAIQRSGVFMQKDSALQTKAIICETIVAHFIFTASPQNPQLGLNISSWSIARTPILDRSEWGVDMSRASTERDQSAATGHRSLCRADLLPATRTPGSRASPSRSRFSSAARRIVLRQLYHWWRHADHPGQLSRRAQGGHYDAHWLRARPAVLDHEVSDFTQDRGTVPFRPQGDVGATIMMMLDCRNLSCERRAFRLVWTAASVIPEPLGTAPGSIASRGCY